MGAVIPLFKQSLPAAPTEPFEWLTEEMQSEVVDLIRRLENLCELRTPEEVSEEVAAIKQAVADWPDA